MNLSLTQLEYIVAVEKFRNFRAAAKACHVTQPTLSMQILKLEDQLGVQIFDRSVHPVRLTPIGQTLIEQARTVLSQTVVFENLVSREKVDLNQEIRLAVIPTLAPYLVPLFLKNFRSKHPSVQLHVLEQQTDSIIENLRTNQIDIGLLVTPLGEDKIVETPLFEEVFKVYAHKSSALAGLDQVTDKELKNEDVLLLSEGHCMRDQMIRICRYRASKGSSKQEFSVESGSIETLCRLVDAGMGYTIVPYISTLWPHSSEARIIKFSDPQPSREVSLVVHQSFAKNNVLDVLKKCIVASLPKEVTSQSKGLRRIRIR